jgi:hypothetical protein
LRGALHFHDETLAFLRLAIHVIDGTAVVCSAAELLGIEVRYLFYLILALKVKQSVQETYQKILVGGCAEKFFERKVSVEVDVSFH